MKHPTRVLALAMVSELKCHDANSQANANLMKTHDSLRDYWTHTGDWMTAKPPYGSLILWVYDPE